MRSLLIILLVGLSFLTSCKKKPPVTHVSGIVINAGSKQPVAGALIVMQDGVGSGGGWVNAGSSKTAGTGATQQVITGSEGKYDFTFRGEAPVIWVEKEQYRFFNPAGGNEIFFLTPGKTYSDLKLNLVAYAWFNPILKGYYSIVTDTVWIVSGSRLIPPQGGGYYTYFGNGPTKYFDSDNPGSLANGDFYYPYGIKWQEHGVWQKGRIDSVFIKSFTTYTDTIFY